MGAVHSHPKASAVVVGVLDGLTLGMFRKAWRRERPITTHEAAQALGRAAAAKRERDDRTYAEKRDDFHARMRAEKAAGWPVDPAQINKELAR